MSQAGKSPEGSLPAAEQPEALSAGGTSRLLGESEAMRSLRQLIRRVAPTDATVLITGPTGVGKEVVADELQRLSSRADRPFIKVNCAAIPESLMEAELFGYEKGAFTGASREGKAGLLELADTGTVLLDEIGEMPLSLQPKLLRAIQERTITRVGGTRPIAVDIRILAATNRNLAQQVEEHRFREDLYYRLNVIPLPLPALRARGNDVILLAQAFLEEFNDRYHCGKRFSPEALQQILAYSWPGNVRELKNLVERLVVLEPGTHILGERVRQALQWENVQPPPESVPSERLSLKEATQRLQRDMIGAALQEYGSTYKAAAALQTSQSTLVRKARQLGISTAK